jgi:hypothetical protein
MYKDMETLRIYDLAEAKKFMTKNDIYYNEYQEKEDSNKLDEMSKLFNIENFCEVSLMFVFNKYEDEKWHRDYTAVILRMLDTKEVFRIVPKTYNEKKYRLYLIDKVYIPKRYEYKVDLPNYIGKPTKNKILEWVKYITEEQEFYVKSYNDALTKNIEFAKNFQQKYPNGRFYFEKDGWCNEFSFSHNSLSYYYTSGENGNFYRQVSVDYKSIPSDEDLLK